ncbi:hypothetical protein BUALT_Bualt01G0228600 [Buddleja alternifolia]|uniref:Protein PAIR1 n=1 Tax=Buddleja alternifolia TaxID=168488 RepID=A0AAV6YJU0_9LAMI|nr:hypothetical protein BUALT_Bualt01G0228600 [Buddleja alternifolia]
MKLKINKACDLSSISVLPPQSRRRSSAGAGGIESSTIFGRSQTASQLRPQQPQQSQLSVSQGVSSQHGLFSQFSQNSQDEVLTNEKIGSQERENSVRRTSCLPPINYAREESQMMVSRTSSNLMRKWSGQEYKCQISEELEHRIGLIETSLSRLGMILDSVQSDIMQVNKGTKEVVLEMEGVRQKLMVHDDSLQSMVLACGMETSKLKQATPPLHGHKAASGYVPPQEVQFPNKYELKASLKALYLHFALTLLRDHVDKILFDVCGYLSTRRQRKTQQASLVLKVETGGWTSVKQERAISKVGNLNKRGNKIMSSNHLERVVIESDEEIDGGFSCLLKDNGTEIDFYSIEKAEEETARILRKARRRKRKYCNTIIIN